MLFGLIGAASLSIQILSPIGREQEDTVRAACERALTEGNCVLVSKEAEPKGVWARVEQLNDSQVAIEVQDSDGTVVRRVLSFLAADAPDERSRAMGLTIGILSEDLLGRPPLKRQTSDQPQENALSAFDLTVGLGVTGSWDPKWTRALVGLDGVVGVELQNSLLLFARGSGARTTSPLQGLALRRASAGAGLGYVWKGSWIHPLIQAELGAEFLSVQLADAVAPASYWSGKSKLSVGAEMPLSERSSLSLSGGADVVFSPARVLVDGSAVRETSVARPFLRLGLSLSLF